MDTHQTNSKTLQFTTREVFNVTIRDLSQFCKLLDESLASVWTEHTKHIHDLIHVVELRTALDETLDLLDRTPDGTRDLINILGLDNGLQVILQNLGEVV